MKDKLREKMEYLEIIELRSSNEDYENLIQKLTGFIVNLNKEYENYTVKLYRHLTVWTDWSFHIHIQNEINFTSSTQLGLRIASAMKEFGLLHHSVWSEEKGKKK